ncbi:Nucleotide-binding universal stress protein, UspA family [Arenibacter nanhaiticus]|uniref:Nucleotide-binding universal stress protein, UspA family n=1 Tax=Arenibacter nanhaiticus TaxID=558155 RepID=A0A1M6E462_9FLAO|nr:universal stress protein [Arenibacter nanhaiticus]SHI80292.1 Nucleotide-binding universal stress protein, UspA family [Arenibacter nanhaiticus]
MRQILIPTDFSNNSWNAITYGLQFFKKSRCTFYLLHIIPIFSFSESLNESANSSADLQEQLLIEKQAELQKVIDKIEKKFLNPKHRFIGVAVYDFFIDAIRKQVLDKQIDMIIMGTKGASGLKKVAIGSNTGDVITKVKCPLLAIPENSQYIRPKEIAFPTDFQMGFDLKVLYTLLEIAGRYKAIIRVLYISKKKESLSLEQTKNKDFLHDYFSDLEHTFHFVTGNKMETAIQSFTERNEIDMIAMVAKNLNYFQRILFKPEVEEISYHTKIPFLVLHE